VASQNGPDREGWHVTDTRSIRYILYFRFGGAFHLGLASLTLHPERSPMTGQTISHYQVVEKLGSSGTGCSIRRWTPGSMALSPSRSCRGSIRMLRVRPLEASFLQNLPGTARPGVALSAFASVAVLGWNSRRMKHRMTFKIRHDRSGRRSTPRIMQARVVRRNEEIRWEDSGRTMGQHRRSFWFAQRATSLSLQ
jgi:hypothetical protein